MGGERDESRVGKGSGLVTLGPETPVLSTLTVSEVVLPGDFNPADLRENLATSIKTTLKSSDTSKTSVDLTRPRSMEGVHSSRTSMGMTLSKLVREMADEPTPSGETRLRDAVRGLYAATARGDSAAGRLLFDRGWGPVPQIRVNLREQVPQLLSTLRLSLAEAQSDPIARELLRIAGVDGGGAPNLPSPATIEGEVRGN